MRTVEYSLSEAAQCVWRIVQWQWWWLQQREIGPVEKIGRGEHVSEQIPGIAFSHSTHYIIGALVVLWGSWGSC